MEKNNTQNTDDIIITVFNESSDTGSLLTTHVQGGPNRKQ